MVNNLDYIGVKFPVPKKDFGKIEKKNDICSNVFCYENDFVYPVHTPDEKLEHCTDLLMKISQILSILKILTNICAIRQKIRIKALLPVLITMF